MCRKITLRRASMVMVAVLFLSAFPIRAQISLGGSPLSSRFDLSEDIPSVTMPSIDRGRLAAEDVLNDAANLPLRFAVGFPVQLNLQNAGRWITLPGGDRIWQLRIDCPEALTVNLLYDDFFMPPGALLYLYDPDRKEILGAFGSHNNRVSRRFATALIHDESIILEYFEPAEVRGAGALSIAQVSHGYRLLDGLPEAGLNNAGNCQVNVNCSPEGDDWQVEKKSVARIIMDGAFLCTGALVNNTAQDCTPYFLTANHCIEFGYDAVTNPDADNFVFYWNYERPDCANTGTVPVETTVGAIVRANPEVSTASASSDFALLELTTNPGDFYDVYYAGWDATGDPGSGGVGIHHPAGDAKKIATHNITPTSVVSDRYWRIYWSSTPNGWSVTEGGSSGSPLFDSEKRIVGQLFGGFLGGQPNCSDPANDEADYGKLAYSWDNAGASDNRRRLRDWLDPVNLGGTQTVNGTSYPCGNNCALQDAGLVVVGCDDNGTPGNEDDDFIVFQLHPSGTDLGTSYTVTGSGMASVTATYGQPTTFQTTTGTAGNGDLVLTITDSDDPACQLVFTLPDPGNCSNSCNLLDVGLSNVQCMDNGTPDDPTDDRISFQLNPSGVGFGIFYFLEGARLSSNSGAYGTATTFLSGVGRAGAGDLELILIDDANPGCTLTFVVPDPGACVNAGEPCSLDDAGLSAVQCQDNGTSADPADDLITFLLDPAGSNVSNGYLVSVINGGTLSPASGAYGAPVSFTAGPGSAGNGDLILLITDADDPSCALSVTVPDPGSCSTPPPPACQLQSPGLSGVQCDDNGTPADPADDFISFQLDPQGAALGDGYGLSGAGLVAQSGIYGQPAWFATLPGTAGNGDLFLTLLDDTAPDCQLSFNLPAPGTCSSSGGSDCILGNVSCQNLTAALGPDGTVLLDPQDLLAYDDMAAGCDYSVVLLNFRSLLFTCNQLGDNTAMVRVGDQDGNTMLCFSTITVTDPAGVCDEGAGEAGTAAFDWDGLRVFPVPARDQLNIAFGPAPVDGWLVVTDHLGRPVLEQPVTTGTKTVTLNVSGLSGGLYYLTLRMGNQQLHRKVSVVK